MRALPFILAFRRLPLFNPLVIRKGSIILFCVIALVLVVVVLVSRELLSRPPAQSQPFPVGNVLTLTDAAVGSQVKFVHGSMWERIKETVLPASGLKIGKTTYRRPNLPVTTLNAVGNRKLFLEFKLESAAAQSLGSSTRVPSPVSASPTVLLASPAPASASAAAAAANAAFLQSNGYEILSDSVTTFTTGARPTSAQRGGAVTPAPRGSPGSTLTLTPANPAPAPTPNSGGGGYSLTLQGSGSSFGGYTVISNSTAGSPLPAGPNLLTFTVVGATPLPLVIVPSGQFRMILTGDDGFEYVESFWPQLGLATNGYIYIEPQCYPRDSAKLAIRIEHRDNNDQAWREVAKFTTRVRPESGSSWRAEKTPVKKSTNNLEFVLGDVSVQDTTFGRDYIGKFESRLAFQVLENGKPQSSWEAFPLLAVDATGNTTSLGSFNRYSNGWFYLQTPQALNPATTWKLRMNFGRVGDYPSNALVTTNFNLSPIVLGGMRPVTNMLLGVPVKMSSDSQALHFEIATNRTDLRLSIVKVRWPDGAETEGDGSRWSERHVALDLTVNPALGRMTVTLAIHPNYPVEFTVRPQNKIVAKK